MVEVEDINIKVDVNNLKSLLTLYLIENNSACAEEILNIIEDFEKEDSEELIQEIFEGELGNEIEVNMSKEVIDILYIIGSVMKGDYGMLDIVIRDTDTYSNETMDKYGIVFNVEKGELSISLNHGYYIWEDTHYKIDRDKGVIED